MIPAALLGKRTTLTTKPTIATVGVIVVTFAIQNRGPEEQRGPLLSNL